MPVELMVKIVSQLTVQEKAITRRVCVHWRNVVHDLLHRQQELRLGSFHMQSYDTDLESRWKHEVSLLHYVPDSLLEDGNGRLRGNSLIAFVSKYCSNVITIEMGDDWNKYLNSVLISFGNKIECLRTQITDMRERHLRMLPNLRVLECRRLCYRETGNLFEFCPKIQSVTCTRMNYESLYGMPEGVQVYDEDQRDRYQAYEDLA